MSMSKTPGISHTPNMTRTMRPTSTHNARDAVRTPPRPRRGFALLTVMLIAIVGGVIALASAMLVMGGTLVQAASDRAAAVDDAALSGIEEARNMLNAKLDSVPLTGYGMLEDNVLIPNTNNVKRSTWVARIGNADSLSNVGEYGVQAEIVSRAIDRAGNIAVRRALIYQQSFARYAYFTNASKMYNGTRLWFALGWIAHGPVHVNDTMFIWTGAPPQAYFKDDVSTARVVYNKAGGQFSKGPPQEHVSPIQMPGTGDLAILRNIASKAGYVFTPSWNVGDSALATLRIEFVAVDADGDGNTTGPDDGYFRLYQEDPTSADEAGYAIAKQVEIPANGGLIGAVLGLLGLGSPPKPGGSSSPIDSTMFSRNCGVVEVVGGVPRVETPFSQIPWDNHGNYKSRMEDKREAFDHPDARCFLGGDERLSSNGIFDPVDNYGRWLPRTSGSVPASVAARPDGAYLWPLSPAYNPNFRGVIFVDGKVGVSGVVRGRVTLVSPKTILVVHELLQATSPGTTTGTCRPDDDVVGLFSGEYILWADNLLQSPQQRRDNSNSGNAWLLPRKDFDPSERSPDLVVHASTLALKSVAAERPSPPGGLHRNYYVNRGFIRQVGGQVQDRAGVTGTMSGSSLHGYNEDLSFNRCVLRYPPPYFPTTGHWNLSQFFEVDPVNFDPSTWFSIGN